VARTVRFKAGGDVIAVSRSAARAGQRLPSGGARAICLRQIFRRDKFASVNARPIRKPGESRRDRLRDRWALASIELELVER